MHTYLHTQWEKHLIHKHTRRQSRSAAGDKWAVEDINAWRGNINIQIQAADHMLFNLMEGKYTLWLYQCRDTEWEEYTENTGKEQDCVPICLHVDLCWLYLW